MSTQYKEAADTILRMTIRNWDTASKNRRKRGRANYVKANPFENKTLRGANEANAHIVIS
jgi:hypothetical protein